MKPKILLLWLSILLWSGCASMAQKGALGGAYRSIDRQRYEKALSKLADAELYHPPTPEVAAKIAYYRGISLEGLGRIPEARAVYQYLVDHHPENIHAYLAIVKLEQIEAESRESD